MGQRPLCPWQGRGSSRSRIGESFTTGLEGRPLTPAEVSFYRSRGPGPLVARIRIPTLLIQGTVDILFTLDEAVTNYRILRRAGVPVKMLWFCGGHGICLTNPGQTSLIDKDTIAWLDRYLKRDLRVRTGPTFEWVDQDGIERSARDYPLAAGMPITGRGSGTLPLTQAGGSGPVKPPPGTGGVGLVAAPITPARAANAVNVTLPAPRVGQLVVGAPLLKITYRATGTGESGASTRVYAQIVDDSTGKVLGNQITPVPITLDGPTHTLTEPLEILAATDRRAQRFTLQLTAGTVAYQTQRAAGSVKFIRIQIAVPTVDPNRTPPGYGAVAPNGCSGGGTVVVHLPRATRSAEALLGSKVVARGRRKLKIDLVGLGLRLVRVKIVIHLGHGRTLTRTRELHACP